MKLHLRFLTAPCVALALFPPTARSQAPATRPADEQPATQPQSRPDVHGAVERQSVTDGQILVAGKALKYKATAAHLALKDDSGKTKAEIFYVAYVKQPAEETDNRPITFVFNGGPGAAAVWLHLGTAGPKHITMNDNGDAPVPPYQLDENPDTWLGATDLVFIDPVGTGYSRAAPGEKPEQFFGLQEDIRAVAEIIRTYITQNNRWLSPKFLAGESYGTTRAAGLSQYLLEQNGIALNGIVLISSVLSFNTIDFAAGNELPYVLYVPCYTAVAHYHKKLPPDLQQADLSKSLRDAQQWATHDYVDALSAGTSLAPDKRNEIARQLSRFTGLPVDAVLKADLRINAGAFRSELLVDRRLLIGRFDARITGYNPDPLTMSDEYDPSLSPYFAAYMATFGSYVRGTLQYKDDRQYEVLTNKVRPWNFGTGAQVATNLQDAMMKNPHMKVMFCNGLADLATPYMAADYTIDHLNISLELRANITHKYYEGGHMLYHYRPSRQKLGQDMSQFIQSAAGGSRQSERTTERAD